MTKKIFFVLFLCFLATATMAESLPPAPIPPVRPPIVIGCPPEMFHVERGEAPHEPIEVPPYNPQSPNTPEPNFPPHELPNYDDPLKGIEVVKGILKDDWEPPVEAEKVTVRAPLGLTEIRFGPSINKDIMVRILDGSRVFLLERGEEWSLVCYSENWYPYRNGYIKTEYIE